MDLTHRVRVPAPLDEVWEAVLDPARLAAVVPGTVVEEAEGDTFAGTAKIKLGSSLVALTGSGRYVERDARAHRVVVETSGTDHRGDAGVEARHTITLAPRDGAAEETDVTVTSTMTWSGRPARLGAGVVGDAVDRVLDQTGSRIAARVAEGLAWAPPVGGQPADEVSAVVDHPVELGTELGALDEREPRSPGGDRTSGPVPSPSPGPSPRPPEPQEYVYRPWSNTAEPHASAARTFGRVVGKRVLPYAGLSALAVFAAASALRRARR